MRGALVLMGKRVPTPGELSVDGPIALHWSRRENARRAWQLVKRANADRGEQSLIPEQAYEEFQMQMRGRPDGRKRLRQCHLGTVL